MMWTRQQRRAYDYAFRKAHDELGRAPGHGEWEHHLPPCLLREMGVAPTLEQELEELERVLVPCGC